MSSPLQCPNCGVLATVFQNANNVRALAMLEGDLFLCADCAHISVVNAGGFRLLTQEEFDKLSQEEKSDIRFAIKCIIAKVRQEKNISIINKPWLN